MTPYETMEIIKARKRIRRLIALSVGLVPVLVLLAVDYARARVETITTDMICECRLGPFNVTIVSGGNSVIVAQCIQRDFIGNMPPLPVGDQIFVDGGFETHGVFVCPPN